jgi:protein ImuB
MELVRLRLEALRPLAPVTDLRLRAEPVPVERGQLQLFAHRPGRSREAADRALARLRAELGPQSVTRAVLQDQHLPEASYRWEPLGALPRARPGAAGGEAAAPRPMVRRLLPTPEPIRAPDRGGPEAAARPLNSLGGPFLLSGGWWDQPHDREYHYLQAEDGRILWVYLDGATGRPMLHGTVE